MRYVSDTGRGLTRVKANGGFEYRDHRGDPIQDEATLARIRALAIPPAYSEVWICPRPDCHLQATGHDARGRKRYRYHPRWQHAGGVPQGLYRSGGVRRLARRAPA